MNTDKDLGFGYGGFKSGQEVLIEPGSNDYGKKEFFSRPDIGGIGALELKEELRKATEALKHQGSIPIAKSSEVIRCWEVVSYIGESSEPSTIRRLRDGELFSIGDKVTNGTQMKGRIERFDYSFRSDEVFVYTDWSGVGMNLTSLSHVKDLPSAHQLGDPVVLRFSDSGSVNNCKIIKVHFTESKVLYDVEVSGAYEMTMEHPAGTWSTRLYNIDSVFVTKS